MELAPRSWKQPVSGKKLSVSNTANVEGGEGKREVGFLVLSGGGGHTYVYICYVCICILNRQ